LKVAGVGQIHFLTRKDSRTGAVLSFPNGRSRPSKTQLHREHEPQKKKELGASTLADRMRRKARRSVESPNRITWTRQTRASPVKISVRLATMWETNNIVKNG